MDALLNKYVLVFTALLEWNDVVRKFPWGVLVLIGGGFALADVCRVR